MFVLFKNKKIYILFRLSIAVDNEDIKMFFFFSEHCLRVASDIFCSKFETSADFKICFCSISRMSSVFHGKRILFYRLSVNVTLYRFT